MGKPRRALIPISLAVLAALLFSCASSPAPASLLAQEYYNLGNAWFDLKKYDQASRAYQTALSWNPELKIATLNLARTLAEQGSLESALDLISPLAESDPENLVVAQYRAWLTARLEGPAAAAPWYAELALLLPGDAATQHNAGLSLAAAGRDAEALEAWKRWKLLDGKSTAGLTRLATLLDKLESPDAAAAWLDAAQSLPEGDARRFAPLAARAVSLSAAQLYADAVATWDSALELTSSPDQKRGEAQFRRAVVLLLSIEDYAAGSQGLIDAWKTGYKDAEAWKELLNSPSLAERFRLEADLKLAGVTF